VTYWGAIDENGDGIISDDEIKAGKKQSETWYDYTGRLAGKEVADRTKNYDVDGTTVLDFTDLDVARPLRHTLRDTKPEIIDELARSARGE